LSVGRKHRERKEVEAVEAWIALASFVALFCAWVVLPSRLLRRAQRAEDEV
jgi:hypothetical protein